MALLRLLAPVLSLTAAESTLTPLESAPGTVEFGRPHRVSNTSWADSFYGVGPASSRLVFGDGLASATGGASWSPKPTGCRSGLGGKAAFPSRCPGTTRSFCTAMIDLGDIMPQLKGAETGTNFTAPKPLVVEVDATTGKLKCTESAAGAAHIVGLPPVVSGKFSVGGLRFGGAAGLFLGDGGPHRFLQSVIVTLASDAASGATSVLALGSADGKLWEYLGPIALAPDYPDSQEGPNEMDLAWLPDRKTILAMIRLDGGDGPKTHPYVNYHRSVSSDRGATWSKLTAVDAGCARPRLLQLGPTMLLSGGRHRNENTSDVILWTATDGAGELWQAHSLSAAHNAGILPQDSDLRYDANVNSTTFSPRETNSYTSLVALSDSTALVTYDMILHRRVNTTEVSTECVTWPIPGNQTKVGCEAGGAALHDGGTYHYNTGRGTAKSVCAAQPHPSKVCRDECWCCRTSRDKMVTTTHTFAMKVSVKQDEQLQQVVGQHDTQAAQREDEQQQELEEKAEERRWAPAPSPLMTRWSKDVSPDMVPEYPRPMLVRPSSTWAHLNGLWEFEINATDLETPPFGVTLPQEILVPFPVESPLSGIRKLPPHFTMWYRRMLPAAHDCGKDSTLLHFEAVDWNTTVYINSHRVGSHIGGYDEFTFDITKALKSAGSGSNELLVGVVDPTTGVKGKQRRSAMTDPSGITYTSSSGIWGTVWLECVPSVGSIETVVPVVLEDRSGFSVEVTVRDQTTAAAAVAATQMLVEVTLKAPTGATAGCADITREQALAQPTVGPTTVELQLAPACRKLWSPKSPHLYNLSISLIDRSASQGEDAAPTVIDTVGSYAGLRTYTVGDDGTGTIRPLLNGKFVYQMATLDQGFWPDGNYAAPTDVALRSDLEAHKQLGFNAVRKHQKVETRRWYHHADVLGLLVWQDMPCCADATFPEQLSNVVQKRRMHPSIVQWETFNEGGGMGTAEFVGEMVALVNRLDASRPVDSASGGRDLCHDPPIQWQSCGKFGNFTDVHHYPQPASPGVKAGGAKVGLMAAGGLNASANGTEATLVRHCDSVCYAHRVNGAKLSDGAFFVAPALNGDTRKDALSLMSTNEDGAWLGIDPEKGSRCGKHFLFGSILK